MDDVQQAASLSDDEYQALRSRFTRLDEQDRLRLNNRTGEMEVLHYPPPGMSMMEGSAKPYYSAVEQGAAQSIAFSVKFGNAAHKIKQTPDGQKHGPKEDTGSQPVTYSVVKVPTR